MVAIESKDDLYVINLLEDFDEFYLELEKYAEENRVPIIDKIGIRFLIQMLKVKKAKNLLEIGTAIGYTSIKLAEIAIESAKTAKSFNVDPKVAMLSFSTLGSAVTEDTTKVAEATKLVKENAPELAVEGELQFDAAVVPSVAKLKAPNSKVQGDANVFVFPSLEAGNIGYKMAQRLGGFEAVGPILQGLNAPVNDLSRGCNAEDVYKLSLITAVQALEK